MSEGCEFYADALVELAAGTLDGGRADRVADHLAGCADCRDALAVIRAVRSAQVLVPAGLEARIRAGLTGTAPDATVPSLTRARVRSGRWRPWALPLAVAAALALWMGANTLVVDGPGEGVEVEITEYEPYGAWPASDGVVAGELVLSELSVEELETLLEEMQS